MVSRAKRVKSLASSHLIPLHRSKRSKQPKCSCRKEAKGEARSFVAPVEREQPHKMWISMEQIHTRQMTIHFTYTLCLLIHRRPCHSPKLVGFVDFVKGKLGVAV
ncbi:hypothetical protein OPV22_031570 [Ensete ventricosum]|uniref:Uncharacterized protein n=1 Tax=Ensete ventricosum TaxID=4639 RepID=A0AAV8PPB6_ENSVE|nr:hypothetical protein OPV22_031570 [Ensete ventricosum]